VKSKIFTKIVIIFICAVILGLIAVPAACKYDILLVNQPPSAPIITGQTHGSSGTFYMYNFMSMDPEGDNVSYYIDWGDSCGGEWIEPHPSGANATAGHGFFREGTYTINSLAVDSYGAESAWGTLEVTMPTHKSSIIFSLLFMIFKHFTLLNQIVMNLIFL